MKRKVIKWMWENEEAQKAYADWRGFPGEKETLNEVDKMYALMELGEELSILDIPCGKGRHSLEFAKRGNKVTGIDIASSYIEEARKYAIYGDLDVDFRLQREFHLREKEKYDLVIAFNHTLGFIEEGSLVEHFEDIKKTMKNGGKFLLKICEEISHDKLTEEPVRTWGTQNGKYILSEKYMKDGQRIENCTFIDPIKREIVEYEDKQKYYSHDEIMEILNACGFNDIRAYSNIDGDEADGEKYGVFVCIK